MIDPERKEAGADFSDRPKSRQEPDDDLQAYWLESIRLYDEFKKALSPIPAPSIRDEARTSPDGRAKSVQEQKR